MTRKPRRAQASSASKQAHVKDLPRNEVGTPPAVSPPIAVTPPREWQRQGDDDDRPRLSKASGKAGGPAAADATSSRNGPYTTFDRAEAHNSHLQPRWGDEAEGCRPGAAQVRDRGGRGGDASTPNENQSGHCQDRASGCEMTETTLGGDDRSQAGRLQSANGWAEEDDEVEGGTEGEHGGGDGVIVYGVANDVALGDKSDAQTRVTHHTPPFASCKPCSFERDSASSAAVSAPSRSSPSKRNTRAHEYVLQTPPCVGTWNVGDSTTKRTVHYLEQLSQPTESLFPDVMCLQGTGTLSTPLLTRFRKIGAVFTHTRPGSAPGSGVTTIVSRRAPYTSKLIEKNTWASQDECAHIDWLVIEVFDAAARRAFTIANVHGQPAECPVQECLTALVDKYRPDVIAGDFSAGHTAWHRFGKRKDPRGDANVHVWALRTKYVATAFCGDVIPTTRGRDGRVPAVVDLILLSNRVRLCNVIVVAQAAAPSDHYPVVLNVPSRSRRPPARRGRAVKWGLVSDAQLMACDVLINSMRTPKAFDEWILAAVQSLPRRELRVFRLPDIRLLLNDATIHEVSQASSLIEVLMDETFPRWPLQHYDPTETEAGQKKAAPERDGMGEGNSDKTDRPVYSASEQAKHFNALFAEKHTAPGFAALHPCDKDARFEDAPPVLGWEVLSALRRLGEHNVPDNRGVPPTLFKKRLGSFTNVLPSIFTMLLQQPGLMPDEWRRSVIEPELKAGKPPQLFSSYDPAPVTSTASRLFEFVLVSRIMSHLVGVVSPHQYGYVKGRSVCDVIAAVLGCVKLAHGLKSRCRQQDANTPSNEAVPGRALVGYLDLTDVFCRVPHSRIMEALARCNMPAYITAFVATWLHGRSAHTFVGGEYSEFCPHTAGVPRTSILGQVLLAIFLDSLLAEISSRIERWGSHHPGLYVTLAAYVENVALVVCGFENGDMIDCMSYFVTVAHVWCEQNNMKLSDKTTFQWLSPDCTACSHDRGDLPMVRVMPKLLLEDRPRPLTPEESQNDVTVQYSTTVETHRYFGVLVDHCMTLEEYARENGWKTLNVAQSISQLSRYLHPRIGKSVVMTAMSNLLWSAPALYRLVLPALREYVEPVLMSLVWTVGQIPPCTNPATSLMIMGLAPLEYIITRMAVRWRYKHATVPYPPVLLTAQMMLSPAAGVVQHNESGTLDDLCAALGHAPPSVELRGFEHPHVPLPTHLDKVRFMTRCTKDVTTSACSPTELLVTNTVRRAQCMKLFNGTRTALEGWSDGSCAVNTKHEHAGRAAVVFAASPSSWKSVPSRGQLTPRQNLYALAAAPTYACGYSAEVYAAVKLFELMDPAIQQEVNERHLGDGELGILLCSDALSWIVHLAAGPTASGSLAPYMWSALAKLTKHPAVRKVVVCHMFAHCGDPRGDYIDALAAEGRRLALPLPWAWHKDAARRKAEEAVAPFVADLLSTRSQFYQKWAPMCSFTPTVDQPPPLFLSVSQCRVLLQLRCGRWPVLGAVTLLNESAHRMWTCPLCRTVVRVAAHGAVDHLLSHPLPNSYSALKGAMLGAKQYGHILWSNTNTNLKTVLIFAEKVNEAVRKNSSPGV